MISIISEKLILALSSIPKEYHGYRLIYKNFITDHAISHLSKLVSKETGDVRIAFDTLTTAISGLEEGEIAVEYRHVDKVYKQKYASAINKIIPSLSKKDLLATYAIARTFAEEGEEKSVSTYVIYGHVK